MKSLFTSKPVQHLLFWIGIFSYFMVTSSMVFYRDYTHLVQSTLTLMVPQIVLAYLLLEVLVPKFLYRRRYIPFSVCLLGAILLLLLGYLFVRKSFFDVVYFDTYNELAKKYARLSIGERFMDLNLFVSKSVLFLSPTALLFTYRMFKDQQNLIKLREQKRTAELSALKNQLNPHFLFNTLNNLYALAVERSKRTPEVIERLSEILDYMLYGCKEDYVSLEKEITLIENYLALEKIRYGKRVNITFEKRSSPSAHIAPLLLLTFIENAFKHGVSEELKVAEIAISLTTEDKMIVFKSSNTKYQTFRSKDSITTTEALGMDNVKKQLELLYPQRHELVIDDRAKSYGVSLKIPAHVL